jgi:hypothetical protein
MALVVSIFGMVGFYLGVPNVIIPWLNSLTREKKTDDPEVMAVAGFYRTDLTILRSNIILFLASAILLVCILLGRETTPLEMMLSLLSYVVMNVLLSLAIMFKFSTEVYSRQKYFMTLNHLGYVKEDRERIINKEVGLLYLTILAVALLYLGNIFLAMIFGNVLTWNQAGLLILFMVIPLGIAWLFTLFYYKRSVLTQPEEK